MLGVINDAQLSGKNKSLNGYWKAKCKSIDVRKTSVFTLYESMSDMRILYAVPALEATKNVFVQKGSNYNLMPNEVDTGEIASELTDVIIIDWDEVGYLLNEHTVSKEDMLTKLSLVFGVVISLSSFSGSRGRKPDGRMVIPLSSFYNKKEIFDIICGFMYLEFGFGNVLTVSVRTGKYFKDGCVGLPSFKFYGVDESAFATTHKLNNYPHSFESSVVYVDGYEVLPETLTDVYPSCGLGAKRFDKYRNKFASIARVKYQECTPEFVSKCILKLETEAKVTGLSERHVVSNYSNHVLSGNQRLKHSTGEVGTVAYFLSKFTNKAVREVFRLESDLDVDSSGRRDNYYIGLRGGQFMHFKKKYLYTVIHVNALEVEEFLITGKYMSHVNSPARILFIGAPTGTGKSFEWVGKPFTVIIVPTNKIALDFAQHPNCVFYKKGDELLQTAKTIVMTYEKFGASSLEQFHMHTVVVDEAPNLFQSSTSAYTPARNRLVKLLCSVGAFRQVVFTSANFEFYKDFLHLLPEKMENASQVDLKTNPNSADEICQLMLAVDMTEVDSLPKKLDDIETLTARYNAWTNNDNYYAIHVHKKEYLPEVTVTDKFPKSQHRMLIYLNSLNGLDQLERHLLKEGTEVMLVSSETANTLYDIEEFLSAMCSVNRAVIFTSGMREGVSVLSHVDVSIVVNKTTGGATTTLQALARARNCDSYHVVRSLEIFLNSKMKEKTYPQLRHGYVSYRKMVVEQLDRTDVESGELRVALETNMLKQLGDFIVTEEMQTSDWAISDQVILGRVLKDREQLQYLVLEEFITAMEDAGYVMSVDYNATGRTFSELFSNSVAPKSDNYADFKHLAFTTVNRTAIKRVLRLEESEKFTDLNTASKLEIVTNKVTEVRYHNGVGLYKQLEVTGLVGSCTLKQMSAKLMKLMTADVLKTFYYISKKEAVDKTVPLDVVVTILNKMGLHTQWTNGEVPVYVLRKGRQFMEGNVVVKQLDNIPMLLKLATKRKPFAKFTANEKIPDAKYAITDPKLEFIDGILTLVCYGFELVKGAIGVYPKACYIDVADPVKWFEDSEVVSEAEKLNDTEQLNAELAKEELC